MSATRPPLTARQAIFRLSITALVIFVAVKTFTGGGGHHAASPSPHATAAAVASLRHDMAFGFACDQSNPNEDCVPPGRVFLEGKAPHATIDIHTSWASAPHQHHLAAQLCNAVLGAVAPNHGADNVTVEAGDGTPLAWYSAWSGHC